MANSVSDSLASSDVQCCNVRVAPVGQQRINEALLHDGDEVLRQALQHLSLLDRISCSKHLLERRRHASL